MRRSPSCSGRPSTASKICSSVRSSLRKAIQSLGTGAQEGARLSGYAIVLRSGKTTWKGTHSTIDDGRTLALVHREHVRGRGGEIETAEIHCFITARFTAE